MVMQTKASELSIERLFLDPPLSGTTLQSLKLSPDGSRVTFLRGKSNNPYQLDLWAFDVKKKHAQLLVDAQKIQPGHETLSTEEKARRERQRTSALSGIIEYQFAPDGQSILFPLNGSLYWLALNSDDLKAPRQVTRAEDGFVTDPKVSPKGRYISFVRDQTLFALDIKKDLLLRLSPQGNETVSYGTAEFIAQEEMDRQTGYWWSPNDEYIAYTRVDESAVSTRHRFEIHSDRADLIEQRYPAAGNANAKVNLFIVTLPHTADSKKSTYEPEPREVSLGQTSDIYLARVDWADTNTLTFQRQTRDQRKLELIAVDTQSLKQRTLITETSSTWINLHDDLRFLPKTQQFIWSSERTGLRQLYLGDMQGNALRQISHSTFPIDKVLAVNEAENRILVQASGPNPLENHVYIYTFDASQEPKRLSTESGWHEAVASEKTQVWVSTHSSPNVPPHVRLMDADGNLIANLSDNNLDKAHAYAPYLKAHVTPEFGSLRADDDQILHYALFKPKHFDPHRKYPVIVRFYGGPGRQFVRRDWTVGINTGATDLLSQYWAQQGYLVFALDNRGTPRRGKAFEDSLYRAMGEIDVRDQRVGLEWLRQQAWVDPHRIGVFGWSYGGYLSLMLLAKANDLVSAGVAVAPVTDWSLYDTHYTERYMDHPQSNSKGYDTGNVLRFADHIKGDLLLMHGMADDNVLFTHSTALMAKLQARAYPFELMTYPGGKHGLVGSSTRTHVYTTINRFFDRVLRNKASHDPDQIAQPK
jgi:dipeptidyl-peptidase-4